MTVRETSVGVNVAKRILVQCQQDSSCGHDGKHYGGASKN